MDDGTTSRMLNSDGLRADMYRSFVYQFLTPGMSNVDVRKWLNNHYPGIRTTTVSVICRYHANDVIVAAWRGID